MAFRDGDPGVPVEDDLVRPQHMIVLPRLNRATGDHQRALAVVLDLIGGEGQRCIVRRAAAAGRRRKAQLRQRRRGVERRYAERHQDAQRNDAMEVEPAFHNQPSSVCSRRATASISPDRAGAQAARITGKAPD